MHISIQLEFIVVFNFWILGIKAKNEVVQNCISGKHYYSLSAVNCPEGWIRFRREKCFKLIKTESSLNFMEAEELCNREKHDAHLASIHSTEEIKFLESYLLNQDATGTPVWLGGTKKNNEWTWVDLSEFKDEAWSLGHPIQSNGCASLNVSCFSDNCDKTYAQYIQTQLCQEKLQSFLCQKYQLDTLRMLVWSRGSTQCQIPTEVCTTTNRPESKPNTNDWIVIQRRGAELDADQSRQSFDLTWAHYVNGFGDADMDFWLGLKKIAQLTNNGDYELRIEMRDFKGGTQLANYNVFRLDATKNYKLNVSGYSGDAGDALTTVQNGMQFTSKDRDNDRYAGGNCAVYYSGAWWYNDTARATLNGIYYNTETKSLKGIWWTTGSTLRYLIFTEMKIRRRREV